MKLINIDDLPIPGNASASNAVAYVDGSFNVNTGVYGYGVIIFTDKVEVFSDAGADEELSSMRNVSGEILGAMRAVVEAERLGCTSITIYYDYSGIEMWAMGQWKCKKEATREYAKFMEAHGNGINISFKKVAAHTGVLYNEAVDRIAKKAVDII